MLQITVLSVETDPSAAVTVRVTFGGTAANAAAAFQSFLVNNPTSAFDDLESTYGPITVSEVTTTLPPPGLPNLGIDLTYYLLPLHFFPEGCGVGESRALQYMCVCVCFPLFFFLNIKERGGFVRRKKNARP